MPDDLAGLMENFKRLLDPPTTETGYAACTQCDKVIAGPARGERWLVGEEVDHALAGCNGSLRWLTPAEWMARLVPPDAECAEVRPGRTHEPVP